MLTEQQKHKYEEMLRVAQAELDLLDKELAAEIAKSKEKIRSIQEAKKAVIQIHNGVCVRLGMSNMIETTTIDRADS
jgi:hypothetical protein